MVIINPNAPSVSNLGSNRGDGQVESTQVDARQSQRARQPQTAQQPTATQSAAAVNPGQGNNNIPLLNNRDREVSDAIRRATIANDDGIANNEVAARESAALNQAQAVAPSQTLQRLAEVAEARVNAQETGQNVGQAVSAVVSQAPQRPVQAQQAPREVVDQVDVDVAAALPEAPAPQGQPAVGFNSDQAPVAQSPEFVPPSSAFQVLQNAQQRLNDVLLPDFANFLGLRASLPAQTQAEQQVENQPAPQPVDVKV